jgi:hypothetical protein
MFALKLTLVPLFLYFVSMSGKWWGPGVAGWLAGLPVVAGPILFLLVLTHGPAFGAQAALVSVAAVLASEVFNLAYARSCRSRHWSVSLSIGLGAWLVAATGLAMLPANPVYAAGAALAAVALGRAFLPSSRLSTAVAPMTKGDLLGRMAAGAVLTILVTSLSSALGAKWSGLLAVFPLIGIVMSVSSHRAHGPDFVISLLRGMTLGRFAFAAFCLCLSFTLPRQAPAIAFLEASVLAILVQGLTKRLLDQRAPTTD